MKTQPSQDIQIYDFSHSLNFSHTGKLGVLCYCTSREIYASMCIVGELWSLWEPSFLHFLTSVCSKGQTFKNGPQKSTPDWRMLCNSLCLGMGARNLQGWGVFKSAPGSTDHRGRGRRSRSGGDDVASGGYPIQVTSVRSWKRKRTCINCCCYDSHHWVNTYSVPRVVLSIFLMFFTLAWSQVFEVGFIFPTVSTRMLSEGENAYIAQGHLSSRARTQI